MLIADFQNQTGDPTFDRTLEPVMKLALEGAGFITAFDRSGIARTMGVRPPEILDEKAALELAVKQGVGVVLSGTLTKDGSAVQGRREGRRGGERQRHRRRDRHRVSEGRRAWRA